VTARFYFEPDPFGDMRWLIATSDDSGKVTLAKVRDLPTTSEVGGWEAHALMKEALSCLASFDARVSRVPQGFEELIEREEDAAEGGARG